jgi:hypothetical protein
MGIKTGRTRSKGGHSMPRQPRTPRGKEHRKRATVSADTRKPLQAGNDNLARFWNDRYFSVGSPPIASLTIDTDALTAAIRAHVTRESGAVSVDWQSGRLDAKHEGLIEARAARILTELREASATFLHVRAHENALELRRALRRFANAVEDLCSVGLQLEKKGRPASADWAAVWRDWPHAEALANALYALKSRDGNMEVAWPEFFRAHPEFADGADPVLRKWREHSVAWPRNARVLAVQYLSTLHDVSPETLDRKLRLRLEQSRIKT